MLSDKTKAILYGVITATILLSIWGGWKVYDYKKQKAIQEELNEEPKLSSTDALYGDYDSKSSKKKNAVIETDNTSVKSAVDSYVLDKYNTDSNTRLDVEAPTYQLVSLAEDQLEVQKVRDEQKKEKRKKWRLDSPMRAIKFSSRYSAEFKSINTSLYEIVQRYFSPITFSDTSFKEYADPLYVMAVSNVEFGGNTSPDVLLAPAIPTNKGIKVTKDNILTFGYSDYLKYPEVLASDRDAYRGPLQMYVTGLTDAIKPSDLLSCEWVQLLNAEDSKAKNAEQASPQFVEGSEMPTSVDGMSLANKAGNYGDRWNYGDAVNRLSGYIHKNWVRYQETKTVGKDGDQAINNRYAWMAMTAIGHNASPGIYYMSDNTDIGSSYYWWPFGPYKNARTYCHYLGTDKCISYIQNEVDKNLDSYKNGGTLQFRLTRQQGYKIAEDLKDKGYVPDSLWKNTCWNNEEKIAYPIQVLYNYMLLEAIYNGE